MLSYSASLSWAAVAPCSLVTIVSVDLAPSIVIGRVWEFTIARSGQYLTKVRQFVQNLLHEDIAAHGMRDGEFDLMGRLRLKYTLGNGQYHWLARGDGYR